MMESTSSEDGQDQQVINDGMDELLASMAQKTKVGQSVVLVEVEESVKYFPGHNKRELYALLRALGVPLFYDKKKAYFNLYALEKSLHYLMRLGGQGFAAPGSEFKNKQKHKNTKAGKSESPIFKVSREDIEKMDDPIIAAERLTTGRHAKGRASYLAILRSKGKEGDSVS